MKKTMAVVGLGYGDEGKGLLVDYLANKYKNENPVVFRYSGGHQVGHTVVIDNKKHVFSNFGSGTLRGVPTFWSKNCTIEPVGLIKEDRKIVEDFNLSPNIIFSSECPITTPLDIEFNKMRNELYHHGSVGVGFGATLKREEAHYSLKLLDIMYPEVLKIKLDMIYKWYRSKVIDLFGYCADEQLKRLDSVYPYPGSDFIDSCETLEEYISHDNVDFYINEEEAILNGNDIIIYEGSQGLMLDPKIGFFPHATPSNLIPPEVDEMYFVTRAYVTKHGEGPFPHDGVPHNIAINPDETNTNDGMQGIFRRGLLDIDVLNYAMTKGGCFNTWLDDVKLVITCLDHIQNDFRFFLDGEIKAFEDEKSFVKEITNNLYCSNEVYLSHSSDSKNLNCINIDTYNNC